MTSERPPTAPQECLPEAPHAGEDELTYRQDALTLSDMPPKRVALSAQVRAAIDRSGETRSAICKAIELDESAMSRFMSGERGLSMEVLDRLGLHLGLALRSVKPAKRAKGS